MSDDAFLDLRVADIVTCLAVGRSGTVSGAARELSVTPSQVSKAVHRIERGLGRTLFVRSGRGVQTTESGRRALRQLEEMITRLEHARQRDEMVRELAVAAPSYLIANFLSSIALAVPQVRVRGVEMPPSLVRAYASTTLFDITFTIGRERLPDPWVSVEVGPMRKALFTSPRLAAQLGRPPVAVERLRKQRFIGAVYTAGGQFVPVDDDCPLKRHQRQLGHEVQTIAMGLDLAARTDQLVFGPVIAARSFVERGLVVEVPVRGWDIREPLTLACHGDRVRSGMHRTLQQALRARLVELDER